MTDKINFASPVQIGFQFKKTIQLSFEEISTFAKLSGDLNPLHHDINIAQSSRFKGIIASGSHSGALFMSSVATHLAPRYLVLGIKFELLYRAPVRPNSELIIWWQVTNVEPKPKLAGYIVSIDGHISHDQQQVLESKGVCLIVNESVQTNA